MTALSNFVADFFRLGPDSWTTNYGSRIPESATPESFVAELQSQGLELRFVDPVDWESPDWPSLNKKWKPVYLVPEKTGGYAVYTIERAIPIRQCDPTTLSEAMRVKASILFVHLRLTSPKG